MVVPNSEHAPQPPADTFCALPFSHLHILGDGQVKICCKALHNLTAADGSPLTVYTDTLDEIWNSEEMRGIRRAMAEGERVTSCDLCYHEEALGKVSMRAMENQAWLSGVANKEGLSLEALKARAAADDYRLATPPGRYLLEIGNLCNLKCRMCFTNYSSRIERDPVHSAWNHNAWDAAAHWKGDAIRLAPRPLPGFRYAGFLPTSEQEGDELLWTDGRASVGVPDQGLKLAGFDLTLTAERPAGHRLRVTANGRVVFDGVPEPGRWQRSFDLGSVPERPGLKIELTSPTFRHADGRVVGVGVETLQVRRASGQVPGPRKDIPFTRFATGEHWFKQKDFLWGEVLQHPEGLGYLNFIGGEPTIIKEVTEILQHLVEVGAAPGIYLSITTNATVFRPPLLELAGKFGAALFTVSIDGVGKTYEYVRYPAKWDALTRNLEALRGVPGITLGSSVTFQAYNALDIVDLLRYLDALGLNNGLSPLYFPDYLRATVLPPAARRLAARRLRDYGGSDCPAGVRESVDACVEELEGAGDRFDHDLLREFMLFTNDLDATRGQSFRATFPELFALIEESGFEWTNETLHAGRRSLPMLSA